jgi:trehalose 6-phosphate phosphatase
VQALLALPPFAGRPPVFIGDDVTDEDGIRAAQAAGGFGVRVGPGISEARYRLADTDAVGAWLTRTHHE